MTNQVFNGRAVISSGPGQCESCHQGVIRVLIDEGFGRRWHAAEIGHYGYIPHNCRPRGYEPAKKAA